MPANEVFRFACCDCGLVHDMVIAAGRQREVGLAVRRNKRATTARRKSLAEAAARYEAPAERNSEGPSLLPGDPGQDEQERQEKQ